MRGGIFHARTRSESANCNKLYSERKSLCQRQCFNTHAPAISQLADNYYMQILVRIERCESPADTKCLIRSAVGDFSRDRIYRNIGVVIDVDPQ